MTLANRIYNLIHESTADTPAWDNLTPQEQAAFTASTEALAHSLTVILSTRAIPEGDAHVVQGR
jgi:hypothetical protein